MSKRGADEAVAAEDFLVTPMAAEGVPDVVAHATGLVQHPQVQGAQQQPGMVHQQDALAETPTGSAQKKQRTWERHRWSFQNDLALFNQVGRPSLSLQSPTQSVRRAQPALGPKPSDDTEHATWPSFVRSRPSALTIAPSGDRSLDLLLLPLPHQQLIRLD